MQSSAHWTCTARCGPAQRSCTRPPAYPNLSCTRHGGGGGRGRVISNWQNYKSQHPGHILTLSIRSLLVHLEPPLKGEEFGP
ncbi:hypothetical protein GDO81_029694 [Engystomops pustulosus]|uniref:Uncharacterized protein n=1 Tax=Engystomops pustulosus TaxID=76066 RepID=A0AAV6YJ48_ENGPU|nr:hypothetical protein GDO81_029694 [Engystomops pustulosus]